MSLQKISGAQAWQFFHSNKTARWPTREDPDRLYPIASPENRPSFKIEKSDRIFCIGSCFAREIENSLQDLNFEVLSIAKNLPLSSQRKISDRGLFNKYNVYTILNELRWALLDEHQYTAKYLISAPGGFYQDYQLAGIKYTDTLDDLMQLRSHVVDIFRRIKRSNIVIITLGLSEVWFDKNTGVHLNHAPSPALIKTAPERFELHILDYSETVAALEEIYSLLCLNMGENARLLISVSPIPLNATFRDQDVLISNSYSKSLLRTAVEGLSIKYQNVNYFPSYEFVTLSSPDVVWSDRDFRHVDDSFVEYIVTTALQRYLSQHNKDFNTSKSIAKSLSLYRGNFVKEAKVAIKSASSTKTGKLVSLRAIFTWVFMNLRSKNKKNTLLFSISNLFRSKNITRHVHHLSHRLRSKQYSAVLPLTKGYIEEWEKEQIKGWLLGDQQGIPGKVIVLIGDKKLTEVEANLPRPDVAKHYGKQYYYSGFCLNLNLEEEMLSHVRVLDAKTKRQIVA